jgi:hypothetical protein
VRASSFPSHYRHRSRSNTFDEIIPLIYWRCRDGRQRDRHQSCRTHSQKFAAVVARRMASASQLIEASYKSDDPQVESARAKMEADVFRAELEYRQAYTKLKALMGAQ